MRWCAALAAHEVVSCRRASIVIPVNAGTQVGDLRPELLKRCHEDRADRAPKILDDRRKSNDDRTKRPQCS